MVLLDYPVTIVSYCLITHLKFLGKPVFPSERIDVRTVARGWGMKDANVSPHLSKEFNLLDVGVRHPAPKRCQGNIPFFYHYD
ncbi:hypothetical protein AC249_AIPGENE21263 [Exaiptasia diaphana]|nr:hypothetical protein AC249_AIPGENE21263 [Exaiptasia diaphana]